MASLRLYIWHWAFMLTSIRTGSQNRERLEMLHLIPKLREDALGLTQETKSQLLSLWLCGEAQPAMSETTL